MQKLYAEGNFLSDSLIMPHQPFLLKPLANEFKENPFTSTFPPQRPGVVGPLPRLVSYVYHCRCLSQTLGIIITTLKVEISIYLN